VFYAQSASALISGQSLRRGSQKKQWQQRDSRHKCRWTACSESRSTWLGWNCASFQLASTLLVSRVASPGPPSWRIHPVLLLTCLSTRLKSVSSVGAATSILFVMTNVLSWQTCDKFVATKHIFCCGKHTFVTTKDMFCHNKHMFVTTKVIPVASPADAKSVSCCNNQRNCEAMLSVRTAEAFAPLGHFFLSLFHFLFSFFFCLYFSFYFFCWHSCY